MNLIETFNYLARDIQILIGHQRRAFVDHGGRPGLCQDRLQDRGHLLKKVDAAVFHPLGKLVGFLLLFGAGANHLFVEGVGQRAEFLGRERGALLGQGAFLVLELAVELASLLAQRLGLGGVLGQDLAAQKAAGQEPVLIDNQNRRAGKGNGDGIVGQLRLRRTGGQRGECERREGAAA